jgi:hypothetical protein
VADIGTPATNPRSGSSALALDKQLEALQRYRGKGQQKVTVEHVHVNAGGRAIVGTVHTPAGAKSKESK